MHMNGIAKYLLAAAIVAGPAASAQTNEGPKPHTTVDGIGYLLNLATQEASAYRLDLLSGANLTDVAIPTTIENEGQTYNVTKIESLECWSIRKGSLRVDNSSPRTLSIPASITEINGLGDPWGLKSIEVSRDNAKFTSIGGSLFSKDSTELVFATPVSSATLEVPAHVKSIRSGAFGHGLRYAVIPKGVTGIADGAFRNCAYLESVTVEEGNPDFVSVNGLVYTRDMTELVCCPRGRRGELIIPEGVKSIRKGALSHNYLTSITLPASLTFIDDMFLYDCVALKDITVASGNAQFASVDGVLYTKDLSHILYLPHEKEGHLDIPEGVTSIDDLGCNWHYNITSISIPTTVTSIGKNAFYGFNDTLTVSVAEGNKNFVTANGAIYSRDMTELVRVTWKVEGDYIIPEGVSTISSRAFYRTRVHSISIPSTVTSIGEEALNMCYELTAINVSRRNKNYASVKGVLYDKAKTHLISVPRIREGDFHVPKGVTTIEDYAFTGCDLDIVFIPKSVKKVGVDAFYGCDIKTISVPAGTIKMYATFANLMNVVERK